MKEILEKHTKWLRGESGGERADLHGADLRGANLGGADLSRANLDEANLDEANLRGANLYGADLSGANLRGANLYEANLRGASLREADLYGADLSRANLSRANLRVTDLREANLRWADLYGADLNEADLRGASLRWADLRKTVLCPEAALKPPAANEIDDLGLVADGPFVRGFRTKSSKHAGSTIYRPGRCYIAPVFSVCRDTGCHPGIYLAAREWLKERYCGPFVSCFCRRDEMAIAGGKARCKRLWIDR
jgi:hypothetical protein